MKQQAFPLSWPANWPRAERRTSSQFKTTLHAALANVENAIKLLAKDSGKAATDVLISTNYSLTARAPEDPGVAVYFSWDGISTCLAVDRYLKIEENLQAIYHCIEAERTKLRHGGLTLVQAAFRGYAALPPPSTARAWWDVLECGPQSSLEVINAQYARLAKDHHPDKKGGSQARMAELNAAIAAARKSRG